MDERQESNQNPNTNQNTASTQASGNGGPSGAQATPDVSTLLDESSLPRPVCEWIKCLRAPAMSLSISVDKQHIPNYDASSAQGKNGSGGSGSSQSSSSQTSNSQASNSQAGGTQAGMSFSHHCTVRYFDLALGAVAVLLLGCLCKTCTGCRRAMKRWF